MMLGPSGAGILLFTLFLLLELLLAIALPAGIILVLVGSRNPRYQRLRRIGWVTLAVWLVPGSLSIGLFLLWPSDFDRTLKEPETVDGILLPARTAIKTPRTQLGLTVAKLRVPYAVHGVDYISELKFRAGHVDSGTLARSQEVQGLPCKGPISFSDDGEVTGCTLSKALTAHGAIWPEGTIVGRFSGHTRYRFPERAKPVRVGDLLIHSGLEPDFEGGRLRVVYRNYDYATPDLQLEVNGMTMVPDETNMFRFDDHGTMTGGVLSKPAVVGGK